MVITVAYRYKAMARLEQITALVLAAGLAIPSYWFFWTMAGGGGYDRRGTQEIPVIEDRGKKEFSNNQSIAPHVP